MTTKEKIVKRLNSAFNFNFPLDCPYHHHGGRGLFAGGWSWGVTNGVFDVGSIYPMSECLKWEKWIYDTQLHEIYPYVPANEELYKIPEILIEGEQKEDSE